MLEQRQMVLTIIYGALLASVGLYGVVAFEILQQRAGDVMPDRTMLYGLIGVALALTAVVIPALRRRMMPATRGSTSLGGPSPSSSAPESAPLAQLFTAQIVTWALCEVIAILGLVAVILFHDLRYFVGFAVLSVLNFGVYRPSLELTRNVVRAASERA